MERILLVEDEHKLSQHIQTELLKHHYACDVAYDGLIANRMFNHNVYDLVLLDIGIPKLNGLDLCREIRNKNTAVPIIMLTALGDIDTKLEAYDLGIHDYLIKPVHMKELLAKVKIFLSRKPGEQMSSALQLGTLRINVDQKKVYRQGREIELSPREFDVIYYLARFPKRIISKNELADHVWGENYIVTTNTIEVYISFLRNKLNKGFDQKLILTKHGFGYYLNPEVCGLE